MFGIGESIIAFRENNRAESKGVNVQNDSHSKVQPLMPSAKNC